MSCKYVNLFSCHWKKGDSSWSASTNFPAPSHVHITCFTINTEMALVVEILPHGRQELFILHSQYHGRWWPGDARARASAAMIMTLLKRLVLWECSGHQFNIKMTSYQYRKSHCGDKTILRPSHLHNGISYTGKMTSLYWIGDLVSAPEGLTWVLSSHMESLIQLSPFSFGKADHFLKYHTTRKNCWITLADTPRLLYLL